MTNTDMLNELIRERGLKKGFIAEKLGISPYWFTQKSRNQATFTADEITILCSLLNIKSLRQKENIFFADKVENISTQK